MTNNTTPAPIGADAALAQLRHIYDNLANGGVRDTAQAKRIADGLLAPAIAALERAALASAAQPSAGRWPPVTGLGRDAGHPRAVTVYLAAEPTDDEMRALHDAVGGEAAAAPKAAPASAAQQAECGNCFEGKSDLDHVCLVCSGTGYVAAAPKAASAEQSGEVYAELPNERAAFEALTRAEWRWPDEFFLRHSQTGEYTREPAISAWMAWQAALRASRGQAPAGAAHAAEAELQDTIRRLDSKELAAWVDRGMALAENLAMYVQAGCTLRESQARGILRAHLFNAQPSPQAQLAPTAQPVPAPAPAAVAGPSDEEIDAHVEVFRWDATAGRRALVRASIARWRNVPVPTTQAAPAAQGDALTDSYVQQVPDKCDRIVWRGNYYHLPINAARAAKEGVSNAR